jgi:hypothetical protein
LSRIFTGVTTEFLQNEAAVVPGYPFTVSVWGWADNITTNHTLWWMGDSASATHMWCIDLGGGAVGDPARVIAFAGGAAAVGATSTGYSANVWNHVAATFASATDRAIFLNGGGKVTDATSRSPLGSNRTCLGRRADSTPSDAVFGRLAECGVWNVVLTDAEIVMLSKGVSPLMVRPESLVAYWPLLGRTSPEVDLVGRLELTVTGPLVKEHTRVIYPWARWNGKAVAAGGGVNGSLTATLGALTSVASGTVAVAGTVSATLGALTSVATGAVAVTGQTTATLGAVTLVSSGVVGSSPVLGSLTSTLGALVALATGQVAVTGVLAKTLAALTLVATDHPLAPTPAGRTAQAGAESRSALVRAENRTS